MSMPYRFLGDSGLRVSALSFGSWVTFGNQVDVDLAYKLLKTCYDAGVNFFDNAEAYSKGKSEEIMGEAIQRGIREGVWQRPDLVVTTKIYFGTQKGVNYTGLSRKHIVEGTMASLKRFQLDYVDVIFCHRPDPWTPMEEVVRGMNYVIERGWAFYWATSEWNAREIAEACEVAERLRLIRPIADQCEYSLLKRDRLEEEYKPLYDKYNYGTTIWSPLASGVLSGKYSGRKLPEGSRLNMDNYKFIKDQFFSEENVWKIDSVDEMKHIADELDCSLAQLSLAWTLKNPHVSTCILGSSKVEQLEENLKALNVLEKLTPEIMERIENIFRNKPKENSTKAFVRGVRGL